MWRAGVRVEVDVESVEVEPIDRAAVTSPHHPPPSSIPYSSQVSNRGYSEPDRTHDPKFEMKAPEGSRLAERLRGGFIDDC